MFLRSSLARAYKLPCIWFVLMLVHLGLAPPPIPKKAGYATVASLEEWPTEDGRFRPPPPPPLATRNRRHCPYHFSWVSWCIYLLWKCWWWGLFSLQLTFGRRKSTSVARGGGGNCPPPPNNAFSEFCRYCKPTSMSFVPTKYLKYRQNIKRNNTFRKSQCQNCLSSLA